MNLLTAWIHRRSGAAGAAPQISRSRSASTISATPARDLELTRLLLHLPHTLRREQINVDAGESVAERDSDLDAGAGQVGLS